MLARDGAVAFFEVPCEASNSRGCFGSAQRESSCRVHAAFGQGAIAESSIAAHRALSKWPWLFRADGDDDVRPFGFAIS